MRFIAAQKNPYIEVELLTKTGEKTECKQGDFLVVDDCGDMKDPGCSRIQLVKRPDAEADGTLFMYQSREQIYQKLLEMTGAGEWKKQETKEHTDVRSICVFSPGDGDGRTSLALHKALECAEEKKVLYISLCEFPVLSGQRTDGEAGAGKPGLSELILCAQSDAFHEKLEELAVPMGKIWTVPPAGHYKDLLDYPQQEMMQFAKRMKEQGQFDVVIFEIGELFEYTLEFLAGADEVIVPEDTGIFAKMRNGQFEKYCAEEGHAQLWERIRSAGTAWRDEEKEEIKKLVYGEDGGGTYEQKRGWRAKRTDPAYGTGTGAGGFGD